MGAAKITLLCNDFRNCKNSFRHSVRARTLTGLDLYKSCPATTFNLLAFEACEEIPCLGMAYLSKVASSPEHSAADN